MSLRPAISRTRAVPKIEGAGVKLQRAFGFQKPNILDPFLLFDDFRNERPEDFFATKCSTKLAPDDQTH